MEKQKFQLIYVGKWSNTTSGTLLAVSNAINAPTININRHISKEIRDIPRYVQQKNEKCFIQRHSWMNSLEVQNVEEYDTK